METKKEIERLLSRAVGELGLDVKEVLIETPKDFQKGDYSTNLALVLAKKAGLTPLDLAKRIKGELEESEIIEKTEVVAPGFINFWLSKKQLGKNLEKIHKEKESYGSSQKGGGKTVVVDYSSPNIAKAFGIGHLRSTIIGQTIYNLYSFLGYKTIGDNHLGDWGTQFGALIYKVIESNLKREDLTIEKLEKLYVEFTKQAEENKELKDKARFWFKKLEEGDEKARRIWQDLVQLSLLEFQKVYKVLDVEIDLSLGESSYEKMLPEVIQECLDKKIAVRDQGAIIVKFKDLPPALIQKSDGATTYLTRDLATIKYRLDKFHPDLIIYEVGMEQELHLRQVFETIRLLGWSSQVEFVHVRHGLYLSKEGKKLSTRKGQTVHLGEILDEAIGRARKITSGESEELAREVGVGAIKYFDLSHNPESNIIFEWNKMFTLEGNSGPYLQYAFARTQSILEKAGKKVGQFDSQADLEKEEYDLLRYIHRFPETVEEAASFFLPSQLCGYLFELARKFSLFYEKHRIIGSEKEDLRLSITFGVGQVLANGLRLLGIKATPRL